MFEDEGSREHKFVLSATQVINLPEVGNDLVDHVLVRCLLLPDKGLLAELLVRNWFAEVATEVFMPEDHLSRDEVQLPATLLEPIEQVAVARHAVYWVAELAQIRNRTEDAPQFVMGYRGLRWVIALHELVVLVREHMRREKRHILNSVLEVGRV